MPPLPPCAPPRARMLPAKSVSRSDQITTVPPSPATVASARSTLVAATDVVPACVSAPMPCRSPPMRMTPPPVEPDASITALVSAIFPPVTVTPPPVPFAFRASSAAAGLPVAAAPISTLAPEMEIVPARSGAGAAWARRGAGAETLILPPTVTLPPSPPPSTTAPLCPDTLRASMEPDTFTASRIKDFTVAACNCTKPPPALIRPVLSTSGLASPVFAVGTATCMNPSPLRSSVTVSPEPRPTLPSGAEITPEFATVPPSSAT